MTICTLLLIAGIAILFACIAWGKINPYSEGAMYLGTIAAVLAIIALFMAILQPISLSKIESRQRKERQQIEQQIAALDDTKDKVKLNEWILTYNDWVNDVNTNKETFGWFSWYRDFDMTEHKIIELQ